MAEDLDLVSVPREQLIAGIEMQRGVIVEKAEQIRQQVAITLRRQERIRALEHKLGGRGGLGMPGTKPGRVTPAPPKKPRHKRGQGFCRPRLPPTKTVQHALTACPDFGTTFVGGLGSRRPAR